MKSYKARTCRRSDASSIYNVGSGWFLKLCMFRLWCREMPDKAQAIPYIDGLPPCDALDLRKRVFTVDREQNPAERHAVTRCHHRRRIVRQRRAIAWCTN